MTKKQKQIFSWIFLPVTLIFGGILSFFIWCNNNENFRTTFEWESLKNELKGKLNE